MTSKGPFQPKAFYDSMKSFVSFSSVLFFLSQWLLLFIFKKPFQEIRQGNFTVSASYRVC